MRYLIALLMALSITMAHSQTVETTPNLITNIRGTSGNNVWLGTGAAGDLGAVHPTNIWGCCTSYSGSNPYLDTSTANDNGQSGQIIWSYGNVAVNYIIGVNAALSSVGAGIQINGYNWSYELRNMNGTSGTGQSGVDSLTATSRLWNSTYTGVLLQQSRTHNTMMEWTQFSSTLTATNPYALSGVGNLQLEFRSSDSGFWGGYYGPQIRNIQGSLNYSSDPCTANPLYSPTCSGYDQAFLIQQCTANPLYNSACPGYAQALLTQQCTANQLSNPACPGYAQAYLDYQCSLNPLYSSTCIGYQTAITTCNTNPLSYNYCPAYQTAVSGCAANTLYANYCPGYQFAYNCSVDGLYSRDCPNYSEAYAKKNVLGIGTTTTPATNTTILLTQANTDPVAQAAPLVSDPVVNSVVSTKSTTANAEANPAAAVKVTATTQTTATATATDSINKETKSESTTSAKTDDKPADKPKTAREQLVEQRREAAKKEAVTRGKELANTMSKAADMAAQVEVQNVVIQAMGFTPGFDTYSRAIPDTQFYRPYEAYPGQRNVDTSAGRRLFGGSDSVHQTMIDSQYNLGK